MKKVVLLIFLLSANCALTFAQMSKSNGSHATVVRDCIHGITSATVVFAPASTTLSDTALAQLQKLCSEMLASPAAQVIVTGVGNASKLQLQRSWERVNAIIRYMSEVKSIARSRFFFRYGQAGEPDLVNWRAAYIGEEEDGPASIPPPYPYLRK